MTKTTCPVCSKENSENQDFCTLCGTPLFEVPQPPEESSEQENVKAEIELDLPQAPPAMGKPISDESPLVTAEEPVSHPATDVSETIGSAIPTDNLAAKPDKPGTKPVEESPATTDEFAIESADAQRITDRLATETASSPSVPTLPPPKNTSRSCSPRCLGVGCIILTLFLLVVIPLIYFLGLRPLFQDALTKQVEQAVGETFIVAVYSGPVKTTTISEQRANTTTEPLWSKMRGLKDGEITFHQDEVIIHAQWFFLPLEVRTDLRADGDGNLLVKALHTNWAMRLFFSQDGLSQALTNYINEEVLRSKNMSLRALQLTEGELYLVYEAR